MADKTIGELPNLPAISPLDLLVAQHNEEATKITGATLTNFFKDYIGPVAATSASQMTNTNKVYIYIGNESGYMNGNWYYYNGSAWVSGGAYNSQAVNTDATLTHEGVPADAEAAGKIVEISETQPAAPANRVWIPETQEATVQVPTWAEHEELADEVDKIKFHGMPTLNGNTYDLNDYHGAEYAGIYYVGTNVLNAPESYVILLVFVNEGGTTYQLAIQGQYELFWRVYGGSPVVWQAWRSTLTSGFVASASFAIPTAGSSVSKNLSGLSPNHQLIRWNFSSSSENSPPVGLTWTTYDNYFTITNNGGSTSETIQPVFAFEEPRYISNH